MKIPQADIDDKGDGCLEKGLVWIFFSPFMIILNMLFGSDYTQEQMSDGIESRRHD